MRYYYIYVMLSLFFLSCNACTDRTISVVKPDKDDKNADLIDLNRQFAKAESRFMKYYIDSLGIKAIQAPMGYWYWIYENVDSEVSPESGDIVTLKYRVSLLEG